MIDGMADIWVRRAGGLQWKMQMIHRDVLPILMPDAWNLAEGERMQCRPEEEPDERNTVRG